MTVRIVLEFEEMPAASELAQVVLLAERIHAKVVELPLTNSQSSVIKKITEPIQLGLNKFPTSLDAFAIPIEKMDALSKVFDDEPTAEALCELLTP